MSKINGIKFGLTDKIFLGAFFQTVPNIIEKWREYSLSTNTALTFDAFLLSLVEDAPKKSKLMVKHYVKVVPKIIQLWQVQEPYIPFEEWCMKKYNKHNEM